MRMRETQLLYGLMFLFFFLITYLFVAKCVDNRRFPMEYEDQKQDTVKTNSLKVDTTKSKDWAKTELSPEKKNYYDQIYTRTHDY